MSNKTPQLKNLLRELVVHQGIKTTEAKARRLRGLVDRVISFAKKGKTSRRYLQSYLPDRLIERLISKIAPVFKNRTSGFTRITKLGTRLGDNAPMALIEFVEKVVTTQDADKKLVVTKKTKIKENKE
ncbi:50S ribosomal protein L17 [Candidatus Microgenomates bacterium]|nr:50S ribosomal protein L17 [Candidatus Microgenomates bacterium]MBI2622195.1 50S ribosomal protein L17 [Candidatus Microgenomates bacterium]